MDSSSVRRLVDRHDEAWNAQDLDAAMATYTPDIVFRNHTADEEAVGQAAVRAHLERIFRRWPGMRFERRALRAGDDFAVSEWTAHATDDAGRELEWDGVDVFPIRDGRIARKDVYSTSHRPRVREAAHAGAHA